MITAVLAMSGCGPVGGQRHLTPLDQSRLTSQLDEVRDAADRGDRSAAGQALDDFTGEVRRLQRARWLDATTARTLLIGAAQARHRLEIELAPPPQPQPAQPAPIPKREPAKPKPSKHPAKQEGEKQHKHKAQDDQGSGHGKEDKGGKGH